MYISKALSVYSLEDMDILNLLRKTPEDKQCHKQSVLHEHYRFLTFKVCEKPPDDPEACAQ